MDSSLLLRPASAAVVAGRTKQVQIAKEMERAVQEIAKKLNKPAPKYELLELTGKGSFGRVFRSRDPTTKRTVAVKIIEVDASDIKLEKKIHDETLNDLVKEISILQTLKDSKAKNINTIYEAFDFDSQLWIVSEFCPGGSVHTLMKANPRPGLEENFIITISRELALALTYVHEAGIIHRDLKAANILITQEGQLQLCDFGISAVIEHNAGKRSTIIGTPYWMAPEFHLENPQEIKYGKDVDCWAFGCTVYELATGQPPNSQIVPNQLHLFVTKIPQLAGEYSAALREFVSFCLVTRPEDRPSAESILRHSYVANTARKYPTSSLKILIDRFYKWEQGGGQRASLFNNLGAAGPAAFEDMIDDDDDWNFSTTDEFDQRLSQQWLSPKTPTNDTFVFDDTTTTPTQPAKNKSPLERAIEEESISRGGRLLARIFDTNAEPYQYLQKDESTEDEEPFSDLPFRSLAPANVSNRETIIDLDMAFEEDNLDLSSVPTIRPLKKNQFYEEDEEEELQQARIVEYQQNLTKRMTKDWKMPLAMTMPAPDQHRPRTQDWTMPLMAMDNIEESEVIDIGEPEDYPPTHQNSHLPMRPPLNHVATMPVGQFNDHIHAPVESAIIFPEPDNSPMIDLDGPYLSRTSTNASSFTNLSTITDLNGGGNAFDLEENAQTFNTGQRASMHMHSQSEPKAERLSSQLLSNQHNRGSSLTDQPERDHQRVFSVQETMRSLRQEHSPNDFERDSFIHELKREKNESAEHVSLNLSYDTLDSSVFMSELDSERSAYNGEISAIEDSDASVDLSMRLKPSRRPILSGLPGTNGIPNPSVRQRRRNPRGQTLTRSQSDVLPDREILRHDPLPKFPPVVPPAPAVLDEDADHASVASELERLFADLANGLRFAENLMNEAQRRRGV